MVSSLVTIFAHKGRGEQLHKTSLSVNMTSKDGEYDDQTEFQDDHDMLRRARHVRNSHDNANRAGAGGG